MGRGCVFGRRPCMAHACDGWQRMPGASLERGRICGKSGGFLESNGAGAKSDAGICIQESPDKQKGKGGRPGFG